MGHHRESWFEISSAQQIEQVAAEVQAVVATYALPWLERCRTVEGFCEFLADGSGSGGADILWALGRKEQAVAALHNMLKSPLPHDRTRAAEWLSQHEVRAP